jgi:3-methylcrotonyl-CoA carboxylase alpha subunit
MGAAAVQAARAIDYVNAGTVEFIVAPDGSFYFMEINTRLQVEHPVTELVTGLDLVEWQLRVAAGEALPLPQEAIGQVGHAIEVRLYAEDPEAGFLPGSGKLERLRLPAANDHVRIDSGVVAGDTVTIFYDPMIAKLIVHDVDRPAALARMREALAQCEIGGPKSNIEFLERLVRHPAVVDGTIDTAYLDRHLDEFMPEPTVDRGLLLAASTAQLLAQERAARDAAAASTDPTSPWAIADGWRLGHAGKRDLAFLHRGDRLLVSAHGSGGNYRIEYAGEATEVVGARIDDATLDGRSLSARFDGEGRRYAIDLDPQRTMAHDGQRRLRLAPVGVYRREAGAATDGGNRVLAPMPGRVVVVKASAGDEVRAGEEVMVIEAMKMELSLKAPRDGRIAEVRAAAGDFVDADAILVTLEA